MIEVLSQILKMCGMIYHQLNLGMSVLRLGLQVRLPLEIPKTDVPFVLYDILEVGGVAAFPPSEASDSCFISHAMNVASGEDVELWNPNHTWKVQSTSKVGCFGPDPCFYCIQRSLTAIQSDSPGRRLT